MQHKMDFDKHTAEEKVKQAGLTLDFDEIARKGSMSSEEVLIAKWYGIYRSRQKGDHMARIVIPGGVIPSEHARAIDRLAETYAKGKISMTTRQAAQYHRLQLEDLPSLLRDLKKEGLTTFHGCGDVTRNVAACPWASICPHRRIDVLPYAQQTAQLLSASRDLDNLPRKFKITFSGCQAGCGQPYINCVGAIAIQKTDHQGQTQTGFRVVIGGGMGWKPFAAQEVYSFVPAEDIARVCRAIGILFRDHGDRTSRRHARLKFVVARHGIEKCRTLLNEICRQEGLDLSRFESEPIQDNGPAIPPKPLQAIHPRDDQGMAIQRIRIPKGELTAQAFARIADLADLYADKHVYSTNRQNLELHGINPDRISLLQAELADAGLAFDGFEELRDIVSCVGTTYCPLAVTRTHDLFDRLQEIVNDKKYAAIRNKVLINITGCPNSCAQYYIADIGFRGLRIREQSGSVEAYEVRIGGDQQIFGQIVGNFKVDDCLTVTRTILDTFLQECRTRDWTSLARQIQTEGIEKYLQKVGALNIVYDKAPALNEYQSPIGPQSGPADFKVIAKDIPCQTACPAHTNVPEYIRLIENGQLEQAHLINQEDNVLPGVLGRICTHPCQTDCRHQWTNTQGPVRICYLKRSAADGKPVPSRPLPAWFDATGKSVAIIGGGPAGLAAARELKRYGHSVTLFEREQQLGGQVRTGVPRFRLPAAVLDEDINAIIDSGIEIKTQTNIDTTQLLALIQQFDAVLLAAGANIPRQLKMEGLSDSIGIEGLTFMRCYNLGHPLTVGNKVVVIGGGFTAVDCARSARRLAPDANITIMYRRGVAQMAATEEEVHELKTEGVQIETLVTPLRVQTDSGTLKSVTFVRNRLGDPDSSGKPAFIPIPDSEFTIPCDTLIYAIGQSADSSILGPDIQPAEGRHTTHPTLFLAGDYALGNGDVIHAVADGKQAADLIDTYLTGQQRRLNLVQVQQAQSTGRVREFDLIEPTEMPVLRLDQRQGDNEVELGYTQQQSQQHARRCYYCNHKFEIDQDLCIHCDWCIKVMPRQCIKRVERVQTDPDGYVTSASEVSAENPEQATYIWIDSNECIRCGNCYQICPTGAISLRKADLNCQCQ